MARQYTWHRSHFSASASSGFTNFALRGSAVPEASTLERIICDFQVSQETEEATDGTRSNTPPNNGGLVFGIIGDVTSTGRRHLTPVINSDFDWLWSAMLFPEAIRRNSFETGDPTIPESRVKGFDTRMTAHADVTVRRVMDVASGVTFWIYSEDYADNGWTEGVTQGAVTTQCWMQVLVSIPA